MSIAKNAFFILRITLGGFLVCHYGLGLEPSAELILGNLIVPLVVLLIQSWRNSKHQNRVSR